MQERIAQLEDSHKTTSSHRGTKRKKEEDTDELEEMEPPPKRIPTVIDLTEDDWESRRGEEDLWELEGCETLDNRTRQHRPVPCSQHACTSDSRALRMEELYSKYINWHDRINHVNARKPYQYKWKHVKMTVEILANKCKTYKHRHFQEQVQR